MFDTYNREISYLRVSVTDRCNLRCLYCMPEAGIEMKNHADILSYEKIVSIVAAAVKMGIHKIRLTGGEPLLRRNIAFLVRELKAVRGISEISMTSNGTLLDLLADELKEAGLDRLNISLDTLDADKYRQLTRNGDIEKVLAGVAACRRAGFQATKINMVLIRGWNEDEVGAMKNFCAKNGLLLQRIHHYSLHDHKTARRELAAERPLSCKVCNRLRLTADGKLKPCLFSDREFTVDFSDIPASLEKAVYAKPRHGVACRNRENWQIGG
ncbi:MAG: radical SAM protein [Chrysiogenales bacterium]|nr:radical SAM protein [Candidatus Aminicenantes bacterium]TFG79748.1 MAG: radical SAM protein [Chrysiogenales bacterium]